MVDYFRFWAGIVALVLGIILIFVGFFTLFISWIYGIPSFIVGEIKRYTEMISQARDEAYNRMINQAIDMGADAIVNVRFMTSSVMAGASELLAYGTAVKLK